MNRLVLCLSLFCALPAEASIFSRDLAYRGVKAQLEAENTRALADQAFDAMFQRAEKVLRENGYSKAAADLSKEWRDTYRGSLLRNDDVGDHAPLSIWVEAWYEAMRFLLGDETMEVSHLRDIWILNFSIPVVFQPHANQVWCAENESKNPADSCRSEYMRHFAGTAWQRATDPYADAWEHFGFAPVVTYWCVFAVCEAALWGSDASLICGEASSACEIGMARYGAPSISDRIWNKYNSQDDEDFTTDYAPPKTW